MITFALFSALSAFYFTMFFTPGPNNAMLTAVSIALLGPGVKNIVK